MQIQPLTRVFAQNHLVELVKYPRNSQLIIPPKLSWQIKRVEFFMANGLEVCQWMEKN
jgi:hypothetical protein